MNVQQRLVKADGEPVWMCSIKEYMAISGFILIHSHFDYKRNEGEVPPADKPPGQGFQGALLSTPF